MTPTMQPGESPEAYQARLDRHEDAKRRAERAAANSRFNASRDGQQLARFVTATDEEYTHGDE